MNPNEKELIARIQARVNGAVDRYIKSTGKGHQTIGAMKLKSELNDKIEETFYYGKIS